MELLERLDKFRHNSKVYGLKTGECIIEGKPYAIIDFGLKEEKKVLDNFKELSYLSEIMSEEGSADIIEEYNKIKAELYLGEFKELFYLGSDERSQSDLVKYLALEGFNCEGKILFSKRNAGFFLTVLGNLYFLPKGESLSHYRPGIWDSGYLKLLQNTGVYLENLIMFCQEENRLNVSQLEKIVLLGKFLERSLLLQYSYLSRNNKRKWKKVRGDFFRGRILYCLAYYYDNIEPLIGKLERLRSAGLSEKELDKALQNALENVGRGRENQVVYLENMYKNVLKAVDSSHTLEELRRSVGYLDMLSLMVKVAKEGMEPVEFKLELSEEVGLQFSRLVEVQGDERRMTSLTRKEF